MAIKSILPTLIDAVGDETISADIADGDRTYLITDLYRRLRVIATVEGGSIDAAGDVAHDAADSGNPVKIGGIANVADPAAVDAENDRVNASYTLTGRARVDTVGNIAHSETDSGNPVKVGGVAATAEQTAVANAERVDAAFSLTGRQKVDTIGPITDDTADTGLAPVKVGAVADQVLSAISDGDMAHLVADLYRRLYVRSAAYDSVTGTDQTTETNGPETNYASATLADITNGTDATYLYYFGMDSFREWGIWYLLNGGAAGTGIIMTVEATWQDDGTAQSACTYEDVSTDVLGAANITAAGGAGDTTGAVVDNDRFLATAKYVKIKLVVNSTAGDDCDWTIYLKQHY